MKSFMILKFFLTYFSSKEKGTGCLGYDFVLWGFWGLVLPCREVFGYSHLPITIKP